MILSNSDIKPLRPMSGYNAWHNSHISYITCYMAGCEVKAKVSKIIREDMWSALPYTVFLEEVRFTLNHLHYEII